MTHHASWKIAIAITTRDSEDESGKEYCVRACTAPTLEEARRNIENTLEKPLDERIHEHINPDEYQDVLDQAAMSPVLLALLAADPETEAIIAYMLNMVLRYGVHIGRSSRLAP